MNSYRFFGVVLIFSILSLFMCVSVLDLQRTRTLMRHYAVLPNASKLCQAALKLASSSEENDTNGDKSGKRGTGDGQKSESVPLRANMTFLQVPGDLFDAESCDCLKTNPGASWKMVSFVKSAASHFKKRELIRRTWASVRRLSGATFASVFVVGRASSQSETQLLKLEHQRYGDVLQYDGPDDYKNIELKTLSGMQWAADNLGPDTFYSSGDDDVVVNILALKNLVDEGKANRSKNEWSEYPIICAYATMIKDPPHREKGSKWRIDRKEFEWNFWPRSCFGGFYSTSVRVASRLFAESRRTPLLRFDDVWVTGVLRNRLGMPDDMVLGRVKPGTVVTHLEKANSPQETWEKTFETFKNAEGLCRC